MKKIDTVKVGQRFVRLVITSVAKDSNKVTCRCDCGRAWEGTVYAVLGGNTKSCGCKKSAPDNRVKNVTGHRFGRLVAERFVRTGKNVKWECVCDCGGTVWVQGYKLQSGHTRSCGCIRVSRRLALLGLLDAAGRRMDLVGKRFARLLVIGETKPKGRRPKYICRCDCGATHQVAGASLVGGHTKSCGCLSAENRTRLNFENATKVDVAGRPVSISELSRIIGFKSLGSVYNRLAMGMSGDEILRIGGVGSGGRVQKIRMALSKLRTGKREMKP